MSANRIEQLVTAVLEKMRRSGELLPGAAEQLAKFHEGHMSPPKAVGALFKFFATDGKRFLDPEYAASDASPFRGVLRRMPLSGEDSIDQLYRELAVRFGHLDVATMAERVVIHLERRENSEHWKVDLQPDMPLGERRVLEALKHFKPLIVRGAHLPGLAREWGPSLGTFPEHIVAKRVAQRLESRPDLLKYGFGPDCNDPIFSPAKLTDAEKSASGLSRSSY
ncbi:MAG: hypothetical protein JWN86_1419 [Planctomycetota bacterium]|nr:hypothetical protein [Planctomycetota bacterium]